MSVLRDSVENLKHVIRPMRRVPVKSPPFRLLLDHTNPLFLGLSAHLSVPFRDLKYEAYPVYFNLPRPDCRK